jgi:hypothetical protein
MSDDTSKIVSFEDQKRKRKGTEPNKSNPFTSSKIPTPPVNVKALEAEFNRKFATLLQKFDQLLADYEKQRDYLHLLIKKLRDKKII